jgi:hypothetical protein
MIQYKKVFVQYALLTNLAVFGILALSTTILAAEPKDESSSQKPLDLPKPTDPEPEPYSNVPGSKVPPSVQSDPTIPGLPPSPMPEPAEPGLAPSPMPKPADPLSLG